MPSEHNARVSASIGPPKQHRNSMPLWFCQISKPGLGTGADGTGGSTGLVLAFKTDRSITKLCPSLYRMCPL